MHAPRDPKPSFRRTLGWVAAGHILLLVLFALWNGRPPTKDADVPFMSVVDAAALMGNSKATAPAKQQAAPVPQPPAPPLPPPEIQTPQPEAPPPEPVAPPLEPPPQPQPPAPSDIVLPPEPVKPSPEKPAPPKKAKKKIKINLDEVSRSETQDPSPAKTSTAKSSSHSGKTTARPAEDSGPSASDIANQLNQTIGSSGAGQSVSVGSSPGGGGSDFGTYYALIREQMYASWNQPNQFSGQGLSARISISVETDGRISSVSLQRSSGNSAFDDSALQAARRVGRIRKPLPDGMDGTNIIVNFKLTD